VPFYRQTEGFGRALAQMMQADVTIPDYTSLAKRAAKLKISVPRQNLWVDIEEVWI